MIRTLFLFAILFTLVAIAFKEPDQSAWDFAQDVGTKARDAVTTPESHITGLGAELEESEDPTSFENLVGKSLEKAKAELEDTFRAGEKREPTRQAQPPRKAQEAPASLDDDPISPPGAAKAGPGDTKVLPPPRVPAGPKMPAAPVKPVEKGTIGKSLANKQDQTSPASSKRKAIVKVTTYYENASRLLEAIK